VRLTDIDKDKFDGLEEKILQRAEDSCSADLTDFDCQFSDYDCQVKDTTLRCYNIFCSMHCSSGDFDKIRSAINGVLY